MIEMNGWGCVVYGGSLSTTNRGVGAIKLGFLIEIHHLETKTMKCKQTLGEEVLDLISW